MHTSQGGVVAAFVNSSLAIPTRTKKADPMSLTSRMTLLGIPMMFALVVSLWLASAPAAIAGTYTVYGCRTPTGTVAPNSGWTAAFSAEAAYWDNGCPGETFLGLAASTPHANGLYAEETFVAPSGTTIQHYMLLRAVRLTTSGGYYYEALQDSSGFWSKVDGCDSYTDCGPVGDYQNEASKSNIFTHGGSGSTTEVQLRVVCGKSSGCPIEAPNVAGSVWLFQSVMTLEDDTAPQFAGPPSGPLVSGGVLAGVVPVSIGATDQGGGVYQAEIEVDGQVRQSQVLNNSTGTCDEPFLAAVPCPLSASGMLEFNTAALSDGTHSLQLLITDAAGNTTAWGPIAITTVNSPCSPIPAAGGMALSASFPARIHKRWHFRGTITTNYARRPYVAGTLVVSDGAGVPGAPICVAARDNYAGAPLTAVASISTNATGGFRYRLGNGPSRTIYFIHRVAGGAISHAVRINVHAPVEVHVNAHRLHNGQVMMWGGRLRGPVPSGMLALMQVWRGTYWQAFQQIRVARSGKWVGRYRFAFTTGVQRYKFRLSVPRQSRYPYAAGASRPIHVTVSG
jgi:hypothetical protein